MNHEDIYQTHKEEYLNALKELLNTSFNPQNKKDMDVHLKRFLDIFEVTKESDANYFANLMKDQVESALSIANAKIEGKEPEHQEILKEQLVLGQIKAYESYRCIFEEVELIVNTMVKELLRNILLAASNERHKENIPMAISNHLVDNQISKIQEKINKSLERLMLLKKHPMDTQLELAIDLVTKSNDLSDKDKKEKELLQTFQLGMIKEFNERIKLFDEKRTFAVRRLHEVQSVIYSKSRELLDM